MFVKFQNNVVNYKLVIIIIFLFLIQNQLIANEVENNYELVSLHSDANLQKINFSEKVNKIAIKIVHGDFDKSYIIHDGKIVFLSQDPDGEAEKGFKVSYLIFLNSPTSQISFFSGSIVGQIEIYGFYPDEFVLPILTKRIGVEHCAEPTSISPAIWRIGLDLPKKFPDSTKVEHIIIHHSATDAGNVDPTQIVRSIYNFHTKTNGWDDIGYNFLIAPDGTIFQGRDNFGLFDKDNVKAAHYCSKNSNTMGICLIGNFTNNSPSPAAINSLELLISWKTNKENLNIFGKSIHPIGSNSTLTTIAGHRDSCYTKTECPGQKLYNRLDEVRMIADSLKNLCAITGNVISEKTQSIHTIQLPISNNLKINLDL